MKLDIVAWGNSIGGLSFRAGETQGKITAEAFTYSEPVNYRGPRLLAIHQSGSSGASDVRGPGTAEDAEHESVPLVIEKKSSGEESAVPEALAKRREKEPTLVSLVPLPANSRRATVLLAPAAEGTFTGYVIDDDPSQLPAGKLRVHNLSPHTIALQFGNGQKVELARGKTALAEAPGGQAIYRLAYLADGKWTIQENNILPVPENQQTQLIVLKSDNQFFLSTDGASGGYLQTVVLRRQGDPG